MGGPGSWMACREVGSSGPHLAAEWCGASTPLSACLGTGVQCGDARPPPCSRQGGFWSGCGFLSPVRGAASL
eukprot:5022411-Alexandrium_andersonii.AAC.1